MKIGRIEGKVLKKVGDIGGSVVHAVGDVKHFMDKTGATGALTGFLAADPVTAPLAAGLMGANKAIDAAQAGTRALSSVGSAMMASGR